MFIVAKSPKGREYIYSGRSAHKVAKAKAQMICDKLNELGYQLDPGEVWHVHDICEYDAIPYDYALSQTFVWGKRGLYRKAARGF